MNTFLTTANLLLVLLLTQISVTAEEIKLPNQHNQLDLGFLTQPLVADLDEWGQGVKVSTIEYKTTPQCTLKMVLFEPKTKPTTPSPCIIFFYGGGWTHGKVVHFYTQAAHLASLGITAICPEYRIYSRHKTTPFECVKDARSAFLYITENTEKLHLNPEKIAVAGASAGGHVAAGCYFLDHINDETTIVKEFPKPSLLLLYNPVLDTSEKGYGYKLLSHFEQDWKEISLLHHVKADAPPTAIFHGSDDKAVPVNGVVEFYKKMRNHSNPCELHAYQGQGHGFLNLKEGTEYFIRVWDDTLHYLDNMGWLPEDYTESDWILEKFNLKPGTPMARKLFRD